MNFRNRQREDMGLDMTPLIDIVFLLLIFFMVSTTFDHNSEINITLPTASEKVVESKPDVINVGINSNGEVYINNIQLLDSKFKTIKNNLLTAMDGLKEPAVIISADAKASHQSVVQIMDVARQLNLVKITFATKKNTDR